MAKKKKKRTYGHIGQKKKKNKDQTVTFIRVKGLYRPITLITKHILNKKRNTK